MDVKIESSWKEKLHNEFQKPYFAQLVSFVKDEYAHRTIYPPANLIFNAFDKCSFNNTKVVIIGQDPYHNPNQANGLCFSVNDGIKTPPSLQNIYKEIQNDIGTPIPLSGNLERWSKQGVFLLNTILTVRANMPGSHSNKGWETFTTAVIDMLAKEKENLVFILWGSKAQIKGQNIDANRHLILKSPHPSPLSAHRGFFGNKHFSLTNQYLVQKGKKPIEW